VSNIANGEYGEEDFSIWPEEVRCKACNDFMPAPKELTFPISFWFRLEDDEGEVAKAIAPNTLVQIGMGILAGFFPVAGVAYRRIKRDRAHIRAIVGGVEDLVGSARDEDGFTKADLYRALADSARLRSDAVSLGHLVGDLKKEFRAGRSGGTIATK